jgi:hypothetical protein
MGAGTNARKADDTRPRSEIKEIDDWGIAGFIDDAIAIHQECTTSSPT